MAFVAIGLAFAALVLLLPMVIFITEMRPPKTRRHRVWDDE